MAESGKTLLLEIVTPYHHFFEGRVESIVLNALDGDIGIFPGHEPIVVALTPGVAHFQADGQLRYCVLMEGYAEIGPHMVLVVCNAADWPEEIDVKRAREAYKRARSRSLDPSLSSREKVQAQHSVQRAKVRLKLAYDHGDKHQKELFDDSL